MITAAEDHLAREARSAGALQERVRELEARLAADGPACFRGEGWEIFDSLDVYLTLGEGDALRTCALRPGEDGWIVAEYRPANITTRGRTIGEAIRNLGEALVLALGERT